MNGRYLKSRQISERLWIEGELILETPTHFGNGDTDGPADMPLLRDSLTLRPLLTGASIAGALRSYIRDVERGFGQPENRSAPLAAEKLFGYISEENPDSEASILSWLMVDDAVAEDEIGLELRDGVKINTKNRAAEDKKKFDIELIPAGTRFPLSFELWLPEKNPESYLETLALALQGLERGEIGLGQRKRRGYGRCRVENWQVRHVKMNEVTGLMNWLRGDGPVKTGSNIVYLLLERDIQWEDKRQAVELKAGFLIENSLLIRSGGDQPGAPDAVHLRNYNGEPVLPGTSLAGVLRGRASRILHTLELPQADRMIASIFGPEIEEGGAGKPTGSRLLVQESVIEGARDLVQTRVMIDRFTGGALPQHLFSEQPLFGGKVSIQLQLRQPQAADVGLLLLLLKDLWTGDLPVGGESSVGRGRLCGQGAELEYARKCWKFKQGEKRLEVEGDPEQLEKWVKSIAGWEED